MVQVQRPAGTPDGDHDRRRIARRRGTSLPRLLPDGEHVLYAALPGKEGMFDIFVGSLKDATHQQRTFVSAMDAVPVYAEPGYWFTLARACSPRCRSMRAAENHRRPHPARGRTGDDHGPYAEVHGGTFGVAVQPGSLAYYSSPSNILRDVVRPGGASPAWSACRPATTSARIAPDGTCRGRRSARHRSPASGSRTSPAERSSPLSTGRGRNDAPVWSPDGRRIVFASDRSGRQQFFLKEVDSAQPEKELFKSDVMFKVPSAGRLAARRSFSTRSRLDRTGRRAPGRHGPEATKLSWRDLRRDLGGPSRQTANGSPTHRTAVAASMWVQSFPTAGQKVQVSERAAWRSGGHATAARSFWASAICADVARGHCLWPRQVRCAQCALRMATLPAGFIMDMTPDRSRLLAITAERIGAGTATVVQNWRQALEKR